MARVTLSAVKKSMNSKRLRFLKEADSAKKVRFGNDKEVLEFASRHYTFQYNAIHGNFPSLSEVSYEDYYDVIAGRDYSDMMEILKTDWKEGGDPESKWLIDMARKLRKRYGRK